MVVSIASHFFEVIMFTAYAQTLLTISHTRIFNRVIAQDDTFPRVHAGVRKHQRRVIFYHHRSRRNDLVSFACHKVQKGLSNLFTCHILLSN